MKTVEAETATDSAEDRAPGSRFFPVIPWSHRGKRRDININSTRFASGHPAWNRQCSRRMKNILFALGLLTVSPVLVMPAAQAGDLCATHFGAKPKLDEAASWREKTSTFAKDKDGNAIVIPTDARREARLKRQAEEIHDAIYVIGDGPWLYFTEASDVKLNQTQYAVYLTGKYPKYDVATGGKPAMRATFSLGPSGHVGSTLPEKIKNSEHYAATDRIFMWVEVEGKRVDVVRELKSMGLTTFLDLEIPLVKGKEVKIFYARYGEGQDLRSDRINGFLEGRVMGFTWDGN